jgi:hypothetical protein
MASSQTLSTTGVTTSPVKKPNNLQAVTIDDVKQFFFTYYREIWAATKTVVKWIYDNWDKIAPIFDKGSAEYGKLTKSQKTQVDGYVAASIDAIKEGNSRLEGTATYYGSWGWTDGSPNDADSGKERYCQKIK